MPDTRQLDPLPGSDDREFWVEAEIHTNLVPHTELSEEGHFLVRVTGHEAQCMKCGWGFALDPGDKIVDGHLYDRRGKLVI